MPNWAKSEVFQGLWKISSQNIFDFLHKVTVV